MSSFKQKLKYLLSDSFSFKHPLNTEQKFGQIILKTYRKIKLDNSRQSILLSTYKNNSSKNIKTKVKNKLLHEIINSSQNKNINPTKNIENMIQTLSLIKYQNSRNYKKKDLPGNICKNLNDTSKINQKIWRNIDYFKNENSLSNHTYKICNRPKSSFNNKNIKSSNKIIYNLKQVQIKKLNNSIKNKEYELFNGNSKDNLNDENINIIEYFNRIKEKQKINHFDYSRNNNQNLFKIKHYNYK